MEKKNRADGECLGVEFYVDEYWRFIVPSLNKNFTSFNDMQDGIERHQKSLEATARRKLDIQAVNDEGKVFQITGVHAGHGNLVTKPAADSYTTLFFRLPVVEECCRELQAAETRVRHLRGILDEFKVPTRERGSWDAARHEAEIKRVENAHTQAKRAAEKSLDELLSSTKPKKRIRF